MTAGYDKCHISLVKWDPKRPRGAESPYLAQGS